MMRASATSTVPAISHATSPSGIGPRCPIAQPPRSTGCFVSCTYLMIESSSRSESWSSGKRGERADADERRPCATNAVRTARGAVRLHTVGAASVTRDAALLIQRLATHDQVSPCGRSQVTDCHLDENGEESEPFHVRA